MSVRRFPKNLEIESSFKVKRSFGTNLSATFLIGGWECTKMDDGSPRDEMVTKNAGPFRQEKHTLEASLIEDGPTRGEGREDIEGPATIEFPGPLTFNRYVSLCVSFIYLLLAGFWAHPLQLAASISAPGNVAAEPPKVNGQRSNQPPAPMRQVIPNGRVDPSFCRVLFTLITLILPLGCIWYPELIANRGGFVNTWFGYAWEPQEAARRRGESPPRVFIIIAGWIILVGIPLLMLLLSVNVGN